MKGHEAVLKAFYLIALKQIDQRCQIFYFHEQMWVVFTPNPASLQMRPNETISLSVQFLFDKSPYSFVDHLEAGLSGKVVVLEVKEVEVRTAVLLFPSWV